MEKHVASVKQRLRDHTIEYKHVFCNRTKNFFDKAELYTKGIVQSELRNIELISEDLDVNYHQMQHFYTAKPQMKLPPGWINWDT
jgi:hypothetical protein